MANKFVNFNIRVPKKEVAETLKVLKQRGRTIVPRGTQRGTSNIKIDKTRIALPPGKRISKTGNIYYEGRKNRSDLLGKKV